MESHLLCRHASFFVNVSIVVFPIPSAGVVRWVNVDAVYLAFIKINKELEGVKVFSVNDGMVRLLRPAAPQRA